MDVVAAVKNCPDYFKKHTFLICHLLFKTAVQQNEVSKICVNILIGSACE
jgi:hypothetical protein